MPEPTGVVFPTVRGARSTSALGRRIVADALRATDPVGARAAEGETNWRNDYLVHFRRLLEAGLDTPAAAVEIARAGVASVHANMKYVDGDREVPLAEAFLAPEEGEPLGTETVEGTAAAQRGLVVPYRGQRLRGDDLCRQLDTWVKAGVMEPGCAAAVRAVHDNPQWTDLGDRKVVVLGAGAEMGPLTALLRWGAEVVAVDLPRQALWERVLTTARRYAGRVHVPVRSAGDAPLEQRAGADVLHELRRVTAWIDGFDGPLVLGNYVYADGGTNVRVSAAVDALTARLLDRRDGLTLAFLATPTDTFAVPAATVAESTRRYVAARRLARPVRWLSAGNLLRRNYPPEADPGINDSLVPQQGPNYALAKRLQRWRATAARAAGIPVSLHVAPATRTRSVTRNRALAAAYAGAHRFGVEIFEPATSNTLMAALLVHDLHASLAPREHPWLDESYTAAHGGLWTCPYAPRSALGLAALLGWGSARG
ncbi:hypothetical protein Val02_31900 [Virgisporangium aliadipatigenens]|uniref:Uncharacterized protein n=1 Tax=Virgisporangium aliadipatigenens TaxID=741659 RepID=A0A8J3YJ40_9ACTN|nr:hypothetical protein [Virgisporangium aliadipatigenens]GIJ46304.1 hypothetical protein Val02_31900 [Virgisporangium aliadipatigenens]